MGEEATAGGLRLVVRTLWYEEDRPFDEAEVTARQMQDVERIARDVFGSAVRTEQHVVEQEGLGGNGGPLVVMTMAAIFMAGPQIRDALLAWGEMGQMVVKFVRAVRSRFGKVLAPAAIEGAECLAALDASGAPGRLRVLVAADLAGFEEETGKQYPDVAGDSDPWPYLVVIEEEGRCWHVFLTGADGRIACRLQLPG